MNYKAVFGTLGKTMLIVSAIMALPLLVALYYGENTYLSFIIPIAGTLAIGVPLSLLKSKESGIYAREGFVIVSLCWIVFSLIGALPFVIDGCLPDYASAVFESVSGFTTTGATVFSDVEILPKSILFWRALMHFMGGMGVLVFVLSVIPNYNEGTMHIFRAESPGPSVGKLVSKLKFTTRILYAIYLLMTVIETALLLIGGMPFFDSVCHAMSTAGTGGFGIKNNSIAYYNSPYLETVIAVFMFLFGVNFNVYYLSLVGSFKKAIKSEELKLYSAIVLIATLVIAINLLSVYNNFATALRFSFFQVTSIISTTGFYTADYDLLFPTLSKCVLFFLMITGASAGSTGGGIKISRIGILAKSSFLELKKAVRPRAVVKVKFEGQTLDSASRKSVFSFFALWAGIIILVTFLLSFDAFGDLLTNLSASVTCFSNCGPGFNAVGPVCNYGGFSAFSKLILSLEMLAGRLEIIPIAVLFFPSVWKKR